MRIIAMVARRCAWVPVTLFGLTLIVFTISRVVPADPARVLAGDNASVEQVAALRQQLGLDQPVTWQFLHYLRDLLAGDLGTSFYTQTPVLDELLRRLPATLELAIYASILGIFVGMPLGVVCALRHNSALDHLVRVMTVSGLAIAAFWLAILLQLLFSMELHLTPVRGRIDGWGPDPLTGFFTLDAVLRGDWTTLAESLRYLALPVLTLAIPATATIVRFTRAGVLHVMRSNFVFYLGAMGVPRYRVIWKYILRSAMIGTLTQIGLIFGNMIAGAIVVEAVFDWPGLGSFAVNSIMQADYNTITGFTLFTGMVFIVVNLAVDTAQALLDPRGR
jgi:peptide/nickel transport system permease protein